MEKIVFECEDLITDEMMMESVWAEKVGDHYKLDNIPFYARGYAWGDVLAVQEKDGQLVVSYLIEESGHSTVRMIFNDVSDVQPTRDELTALGCSSEISHIAVLIAVDIPPKVSYGLVKLFLDKGEQENKWEYEEGCIAQDGYL
ncbi:DUF4265 domain-containing protein [Sphingobacterium bambusae]|uniref:DUF4265 domain-containing protein n=1 Tax=Sphingobacterium bambusae TaxID=662858 RepID=A0ABW6BD44_9SPHI|nr:DUF4265 domain-containing protein [Sphingobacterium bambusae]WPL49590.1 DUF4265 domain-containing protein [Sphingobacterium bambusae]